MANNHPIIIVKFTNGRIMTYCDPAMDDIQANALRDQIIETANKRSAMELPNLLTILGHEVANCTIAHGTCSEEGVGVDF